MYLTSFCPPPALVVRMLVTPLLNRVVPPLKIARVGLEPSLLTILLPPRLAGWILARLLSSPCASVRFEIPAAIHTSLSLPVCTFHPCILRKRAAYENNGTERTEILRGNTTNRWEQQIILLGALSLIAYKGDRKNLRNALTSVVHNKYPLLHMIPHQLFPGDLR